MGRNKTASHPETPGLVDVQKMTWIRCVYCLATVRTGNRSEVSTGGLRLALQLGGLGYCWSTLTIYYD